MGTTAAAGHLDSRQGAGRDPGRLIWLAAAGCWVVVVVLIALADINVADHDTVIGHSALPGPLRLLAFDGAWLVMIGAMMLPTIVPMVRLFTVVSGRAARAGAARTAFLGAYFAVWTAFAMAALAADTQVHELVEHWAWLERHDALVLAGALATAGAFQFTSLKTRCLRVCRDPMALLFAHYRRGTRAAWLLGVRHAVSCLGCCWALMLLMFATGVGSLAWMAGLTAVMVAEKTTRWGARLVTPVGVLLLLSAALIGAGSLRR